MREKLNYTELIGNDGNVVFSAWSDSNGKFFAADTHAVIETAHLVNANDVSYDEYLGWLENGHEIELADDKFKKYINGNIEEPAEKKIFLIQQGKKESQFKLFEMKNGSDVPSITPIGFTGLGTDYAELSKFEHQNGREHFYKSKNLVRNGVPLDIVSAIQKINPNAKVLFSNNYCSGMMEDITNLPKEYSIQSSR